MFTKILIANRGEIALRIIHACRELGVKTVAIHSKADEDSLHVRFADESVCVGPPESALSYLNVPNIISAAEITDAEAIHPGYGFLAENADFAEICESSRIKFIGPSPESMRAMGNKSLARRLMEHAGVPILTGREIKGDDPQEALKAAGEIGYPVLIKASGGGGGKGMRIAYTDASLVNSFQMARAEAQVAFGTPEVYLEKFVPKSRHVEVQVLGDVHGHIVHLGDRDCTIQRRYQKLIEESPSPALSPEARKEICCIAVRAAQAVEYVNAGTVEFILDQDGSFYFLEMNTRIQVEHPVTEMVTGIDLVKEQIRIAAGMPLPFTQEDIQLRGHSIECRINAEHPETFAPSPGRVTAFHMPGGMGIRVDTAAHSECVISPYYDSLVAKLVAHARDREECIARMAGALEEFHVEGIRTTIPYLKKVIADQRFREGRHYTENVEPLP